MITSAIYAKNISNKIFIFDYSIIYNILALYIIQSLVKL